MRKVYVSMAGMVAILVLISGVAWAQTTPTYPTTPAQPQQAPSTPSQNMSPGQVPSVSSLKPFSAEADFMSLAGYLRYLMYQQNGQWITRAEAVRFVRQQGAQ
jgi:hypothetical protein